MAHLRDFLRNGRMFTVAVLDPDTGNPVDLDIWIQRPTPLQHDECMRKANTLAARKRAAYAVEGSEDLLILTDQLRESSDEDLIALVTRRESASLLRQANEEVLWSEEIGSKWDGTDEETGEGIDYAVVLEALGDKYLEYQRALENDGVVADVTEDPDVKALLEIQQRFEAEVDERAQQLLQSIRKPWEKKPREELIQAAVRETIETDVQIAWFTEYRMQQLFYGCRDPEDHKQLYFASLEELYEQPDVIRTSLLVYYDQVDGGPDHTKALPTPVDSSPSSELSEGSEAT